MLAAVLVLLYEQAGVLRVLLTTRSKLLRAHPGQTALPGGKVDEKDRDFVETAVCTLQVICLSQDGPYITWCSIGKHQRRLRSPETLPMCI
jgi:peroxisomal coenzyme A diphosphatase NUDT7